MKDDKILREQFKKEFETPEISFEEWAEQRGVFADAPQTELCPVPVLADNVNGRPVRNAKRAWLFGAPALALFVALVILLACLLPILLTPQKYGVNDTDRVKIDLSEITSQEDIYLYDMSNIYEQGVANKDILREDPTRVMLYAIEKCLLSVNNSDREDGFYINYQIRTYAYYEFVRFEEYNELNKSSRCNNKDIKYEVKDFYQPTGYARFAFGKYEYFIEAYGLPNVTVLNEQNFLNLLNQILI